MKWQNGGFQWMVLAIIVEIVVIIVAGVAWRREHGRITELWWWFPAIMTSDPGKNGAAVAAKEGKISGANGGSLTWQGEVGFFSWLLNVDGVTRGVYALRIFVTSLISTVATCNSVSRISHFPIFFFSFLISRDLFIPPRHEL